jgi:hypothetical protein
LEQATKQVSASAKRQMIAIVLFMIILPFSLNHLIGGFDSIIAPLLGNVNIFF